MKEILKIIEKRILLAEKKKGESDTVEMEAFWDGQLRCAQALLNEIAHLTTASTGLATAAEPKTTNKSE